MDYFEKILNGERLMRERGLNAQGVQQYRAEMAQLAVEEGMPREEAMMYLTSPDEFFKAKVREKQVAQKSSADADARVKLEVFKRLIQGLGESADARRNASLQDFMSKSREYNAKMVNFQNPKKFELKKISDPAEAPRSAISVIEQGVDPQTGKPMYLAVLPTGAGKVGSWLMDFFGARAPTGVIPRPVAPGPEIAQDTSRQALAIAKALFGNVDTNSVLQALLSENAGAGTEAGGQAPLPSQPSLDTLRQIELSNMLQDINLPTP